MFPHRPSRSWFPILFATAALALLPACGSETGDATSDTAAPATGLGTVTTSANPATTATTVAAVEPIAVGASADVGDGVTVTVDRAAIVDAVNNGLGRGRFVRIEVTIANEGGIERPYAPIDFVLELADGTAVPAFAYADQDRLGFGSLGTGATRMGALAWRLEPGATPGVVLYAPDDGPPLAAWDVASIS